MKKLTALLLCLSLVLTLFAGCSDSDTPATTQAPTEATTEPTTEATTESTTEPTTVPTEPPVLYTNPLTGEALDAPITTIPLAVSMTNTQDALPHRGAVYADLYFESYVNGTIVRGLAIYADITEAESVGAVRSARPLFTDICKHYGMLYAHTGASPYGYQELSRYGILHKVMDVDNPEYDYSYRAPERKKKIGELHSVVVNGTGLLEHMETVKKVDMTLPEDANFGLTFAEDGTPAGGETANTVEITIKYGSSRKGTTMIYNEESRKYEYNQYGQTMRDELTDEVESFTNVVVMFAEMYGIEGYQYARFNKGGEGYFACGGKIIPITWKCEGNTSPFTFYTADGEPLDFGVGSSYIAITSNGAPISYK